MSMLDGQTAIVTGSGGLMGGPIAVRLAQAGADVLLNDRAEGRTDPFEKQIRSLGRDAVSVTASVLRPEGAQRVVDTALERWGRVDMLINVVGGIKGPVRNRLWEMSLDDWEATIAINLKGTFNCTKLVLPGMMERRAGRIVNIASIAWGGDPEANPAYVTAKAGIVALTKSLAVNLGPYNINVNAVAPGVTMTRVVEKMPELDSGTDGGPSARQRTTPLGRLNEPDDIAAAVEYLVSPAARNVSGQLITVAGGLNPAL